MRQQIQQSNRILDLEEGQKVIASNLHLLKIDYLINERERLQIQVQELMMNNQMLRKINGEIYGGDSVGLESVMKRNLEMERLIVKLVEENREMRTNRFLADQVDLENEKEHRQILDNYEKKIMQLRLEAQVKQFSIQKLEEGACGVNWVSATARRVEIFDEIEYIEDLLKQNLEKNIKFYKQNQKLRVQNQIMREKMDRMERLMASKCSYLEFKDLNNGKRVKSMPKNKVEVRLARKQNQSLCKEINPCETRFSSKKDLSVTNFTDVNPQDKAIAYLNQEITMKNLQIKGLIQKIRQLEKRLQQATLAKESAFESNRIYQQSYKKLKCQANSYEALAKVLISYLNQRNKREVISRNETVDELGLEDRKLKRVIQKIQKQAKIHRIEPQDWQKMQKTIEQRLSYNKITLFGCKRNRANSCIIDYISPAPSPALHPLKPALKLQQQFSLHLEDSNFGQSSPLILGVRKKGHDSDVFSDVLLNL